MTEDKFLNAIKGYKKIGTLGITILAVLFGPDLGIDPEGIKEIVFAGAAYILGQSVQDSQIERTKHFREKEIKA